jgi:di/tricarboxylate transporter
VVVVSRRSQVVGRRVSELPLPDSPYRVKLVALSREGEALAEPLGQARIEAGDTVVLEVADDFFYENRRQIDFSLIKRLRGYRVQRRGRAAIALVITVTMILLASFNVTSMLNAALLATAAMLLTGCLTISRAWQSIEWTTLVVLGAAVGLEAAVTGSGLSDVIANLLYQIGGSDPRLALAAVFAGCIVMTNVITNAAAAAFMFPIAVALAGSLGVSFMPFAVILMLGSSYALINPAGYQTNLMVQEPGQYEFTDFVKLGLPLTVVVGIVVVLLTPLIHPF